MDKKTNQTIAQHEQDATKATAEENIKELLKENDQIYDSDDEVVNSNQIPVKEGNLSRCVTKVSIRF